jgi:hypothetical protein
MNLLEKYLHKISYKFPKGYPDLTQESDRLILENELNKLGTTIDLNEVKVTDTEEETIYTLSNDIGEFRKGDIIKITKITNFGPEQLRLSIENKTGDKQIVIVDKTDEL